MLRNVWEDRWIPTRSATPSTALVPQRKVGFPIPNTGLLLGFQGTTTARREGISSPFRDAGGCTSPQNSGPPYCLLFAENGGSGRVIVLFYSCRRGAMTESRKLAAILAADVVGFSRLTGADEDRTLARLRALRSDLIDPT